MQRVFQQVFHVPGTLAANITPKFTAPFNYTIIHVSAVASNDSDATLKIGTSADDDIFLAAATIGDSGTPKEFDRDDFIGTQYPRVADGDIFVITLDFDGSAGTAAQNVTIVITCLEG